MLYMTLTLNLNGITTYDQDIRLVIVTDRQCVLCEYKLYV